MRVKITRELRGSIDGIQLTRFIAGEVYNVNASFASYLIAERAAEPAFDVGDEIASRDRADDRARPPVSRLRK